ncbi:MAG: M20/M25/M40 family metallo-hydrolase [Spirochaetia bacterium]|nr:M20/M25/M40 family metallo-hydrolase [Spirochaetia bacterium]
MSLDRKAIGDDFKKDIAALCATHGVSGFEDETIGLIKNMIRDHVDEMDVDVMKNLIAFKKGNGKAKVMIVAHTDEIGLIVKRIDSKGFLWFEVLGGVRAQALFGKHVVVKTALGKLDGLVNYVKPGRPDFMEQIPDLQDFFIDVGAKSREEAEEMGVEVGNPISIDYPVHFLGKDGSRVAGKALDNRACVFQLVEVLKLLKNEQNKPDIYAVFSSQEEVGCRGAKTAAYNLKPDIAISLDIAIANDLSDVADRKISTALDKGPVIKIMDRSKTSSVGVISTPSVVDGMKKVAREAGIPYQLEVYTAGTTDSATVHLEKGGIASGAILLPTRYVHSYELASVHDLVAGIELLYFYIKALS